MPVGVRRLHRARRPTASATARSRARPRRVGSLSSAPLASALTRWGTKNWASTRGGVGLDALHVGERHRPVAGQLGPEQGGDAAGADAGVAVVWGPSAPPRPQ